jgi:hypothetical protein
VQPPRVHFTMNTSSEKEARELSRKTYRVRVITLLGTVLLGLGFYLIFAAKKPALHPSLDYNLVVSFTVVGGALIWVWGGYQEFALDRRKRKLSDDTRAEGTSFVERVSSHEVSLLELLYLMLGGLVYWFTCYSFLTGEVSLSVTFSSEQPIYFYTTLFLLFLVATNFWYLVFTNHFYDLEE